MREVYIKYNPYRVGTKIKINGKLVGKNSELNVGDKRLQEWIDELPKILVKEYNTKDFNIVFKGIRLDYEDLVSVAKNAEKDGFQIQCSYLAGKEINDKQKAIKSIFENIQNTPIDELKEVDIVNAFDEVLNSECEINVIATMSAGKSTLINALLRKKLMPSKQEACTAIITKIKDNKNKKFSGKLYDKNGVKLIDLPRVSFETMEEVNNSPYTSTIELEGDIPFIRSTKDIKLVLVDTPGPNNSQDEGHRKATYRMLEKSSKNLILYILNATQLGVEDDSNLLNYISESMKSGGKQSKDRFMFVVNKLDTFRYGEDSVESAINKVRKYLNTKGIENPNIYPASALVALDIRTLVKDITDINSVPRRGLDKNIYDAIYSIKKINRNEQLYLEKYTPLSSRYKKSIDIKVKEAYERGDEKGEALIHTGIPAIEEGIRIYINKYAKTSRIRSLVDTVNGKLESAKVLVKMEMQEDINRQKENTYKMKAIKLRVNSIKSLKNHIEKSILEEIVEEIDFRLKDFQETQEKIEKSNLKLKWIEYIEKRIDSILDI